MTTAVQLRRLFRIVNGGTPTSDTDNWDGPIIWITPDDLGRNDGPLINESARTLTERGLRSAANLVPRKSLILSTRAPIGYLAIADKPMAFNQGCKALVPQRELDERFFYYQLLAKKDDLQARGQGSTFAELSASSLASIRVACPSGDEQRRIAGFLDLQQARHAELLIAIERLALLSRERLHATRDIAFADLRPRARLKWFVRGIAQGSSPLAEDRKAIGDEWGVLKLSAVSRGRFFPSEHKALPDASPASSLRPEAGDLLVTRSNTPKLVGDCCVVEETPSRIRLPDLIYKVSLRRDLLPRYAMHFLLSSPGRAQVEASARGTSQSMVKLRGSDILNVEMPVPDPSTQAAIARRLDSLQEKTEELSHLVASYRLRIAERERALITATVTGQLDPSSYRESTVPA